MACLISPAFWVYIICLIGAVAIIKVIIPWAITFFELPDPIGRVLMILLWIAIAVVGVYFIIGLLSCLFSGGGIGGALTFPHGR